MTHRGDGDKHWKKYINNIIPSTSNSNGKNKIERYHVILEQRSMFYSVVRKTLNKVCTFAFKA